jgi:N-hydroxyarylamine O-acetyltransferase
MSDTAIRDRMLHRIGLTEVPTADADGLRSVHRAFVLHVPYENIAVQLGESEPLDPQALVRRVLHGGRGGYCFEANTVLQTLLETLGFVVERRRAIVGSRDAYRTGEPTNHLALIVHTPHAGPFIAEAGLGEGPLDPLPLTAGPVASGAFQFVIERDSEGWWVAQHPYGSIPGFWFSDMPATLADFQPHHARLSMSPSSPFVQTLVIQRPVGDHIVALRARTLSIKGPGRRERVVLDGVTAFAATIRDRFEIDPAVLGQCRLA